MQEKVGSRSKKRRRQEIIQRGKLHEIETNNERMAFSLYSTQTEKIVDIIRLRCINEHLYCILTSTASNRALLNTKSSFIGSM